MFNDDINVKLLLGYLLHDTWKDGSPPPPIQPKPNPFWPRFETKTSNKTNLWRQFFLQRSCCWNVISIWGMIQYIFHTKTFQFQNYILNETGVFTIERCTNTSCEKKSQNTTLLSNLPYPDEEKTKIWKSNTKINIYLFSGMPLEHRAPQSHPAHTPRQLIFLSASIRIWAAVEKTC